MPPECLFLKEPVTPMRTSFYKDASKTIGFKVQNVVDPKIAALLDDDGLSRFGFDVEELEDKLRSMHSIIAKFYSKISYVMAENAGLRQQLSSSGICQPPPPGMYPHPSIAPMSYPWMPCPPYVVKLQGSQVPLVPIPRLKPQQPVPTAKGKRNVSKKVEGRTKKVVSVSFLGLLFVIMLFGGLVPIVNLRFRNVGGGIPGTLAFVGDRLYNQNRGRVLRIDKYSNLSCGKSDTLNLLKCEEIHRKGADNFDAYFDAGWSRELGSSSEFSEKRVFWEESSHDYVSFLKKLGVLRTRADRARSREEAFDGYMAIGMVLYDHQLFKEALVSFRRDCELQPTDVRLHFRTGNCLYVLGKYKVAKEEFLLALEAVEAGGNQWGYLLPQIYVNLGIALEGVGMALSACEYYREAAILCPTHFRALKLLGSALFRVGEYRAIVKALEKAIFMKQDYVDAHCDCRCFI